MTMLEGSLGVDLARHRANVSALKKSLAEYPETSVRNSRLYGEMDEMLRTIERKDDHLRRLGQIIEMMQREIDALARSDDYYY
jgi:hypothetical protein